MPKITKSFSELPSTSTDADSVAVSQFGPTTRDDVRRWYSEVRPNRGGIWPELPEGQIDAVVVACNRERSTRRSRDLAEEPISNIQQYAQPVRTAVSMLVDNIPHLNLVLEDWPKELDEPEDVYTNWVALNNLYSAAKAAGPSLVPIRKFGGQSKACNNFAVRIGIHIKGCLELKGIKASCKPDSPLIRFVKAATCNVYGDVITNEALSASIQRYIRQQEK